MTIPPVARLLLPAISLKCRITMSTMRIVVCLRLLLLCPNLNILHRPPLYCRYRRQDPRFQRYAAQSTKVPGHFSIQLYSLVKYRMELKILEILPFHKLLLPLPLLPIPTKLLLLLLLLSARRRKWASI